MCIYHVTDHLSSYCTAFLILTIIMTNTMRCIYVGQGNIGSCTQQIQVKGYFL